MAKSVEEAAKLVVRQERRLGCGGRREVEAEGCGGVLLRSVGLGIASGEDLVLRRTGEDEK